MFTSARYSYPNDVPSGMALVQWIRKNPTTAIILLLIIWVLVILAWIGFLTDLFG